MSRLFRLRPFPSRRRWFGAEDGYSLIVVIAYSIIFITLVLAILAFTYSGYKNQSLESSAIQSRLTGTSVLEYEGWNLGKDTQLNLLNATTTRVTAKTPGSINGVQPSVTMTLLDPPTHVHLSSNVSTMQKGTTIAISVQGSDASGNPVSLKTLQLNWNQSGSGSGTIDATSGEFTASGTGKILLSISGYTTDNGSGKTVSISSNTLSITVQ